MGICKLVGSITLGVAALTAALRPFLSPPISFVLYQVVMTGSLITIATYDPLAAKTTFLLGKDKGGGLHPLGLLFFWPYHLGLRIRLLIRRQTSTEPVYHQILPGWYLGGWPASRDLLPSPDASVLDVTCELPRCHQQRYLCLPVWDTHAPDAALINNGVQWALKEREAGHDVYIHCAHGHGRSATVLCAVLVATGVASSIEEAVAIIRAVRPRVRLNSRQAAAARQWLQHHSQAS